MDWYKASAVAALVAGVIAVKGLEYQTERIVEKSYETRENIALSSLALTLHPRLPDLSATQFERYSELVLGSIEHIGKDQRFFAKYAPNGNASVNVTWDNWYSVLKQHDAVAQHQDSALLLLQDAAGMVTQKGPSA